MSKTEEFQQEEKPENVQQSTETVLEAENKVEPETELNDSLITSTHQKEIPQAKNSAPKHSTRLYLIISTAYLLFTVTDGAIRMIVLFFAYIQGFNPFEIGIMFVLYEACGIATNLLAGVIGSRVGLKFVLLFGLTLQLVSFAGLLGMNFLMQVWFQKQFYVGYIAVIQALSGVAKDSIKMSGKSLTKLTTNESDHSLLFKLVAFLTGAKNGMKGVGYFIGTLTLNFVGFAWSIAIMSILIIAAFPGVFFLEKSLGRSTSKLDFNQIFCKGWNVNVLSAARFFLFGSRDLWFEISLPLFLRGILGWSYITVGMFMAGWIIIYGGMQSFTPQLVLKPLRCCFPPTSKVLIPWVTLLTLLILVIATAVELITRLIISAQAKYIALMVVLIVGLILFALMFAVNSAIHSFLILVYTNKDKVAMNVGFYYMANAGGRMLGTVISGIIYNYLGLAACLWASGSFLAISTVLTFFLRETSTPTDCNTTGE